MVKEESEEEVYDEGDDKTEDYWFFVDKWFAKSEGDKQIVRELIPTDKDGRPLKGALDGMYGILCCGSISLSRTLELLTCYFYYGIKIIQIISWNI